MRKWQVEACDGNRCAGLLLSFFEYWHNIKLEMRDKNITANEIAMAHGDPPMNSTSLIQFHTEEELENGLLGLYKKNTIKHALDLLVSKKFITITKNPNPKYKYDRTRHFIFHDDAVNDWILDYRESKIGKPSSKNGGESPDFGGESPVFGGTIPKTSSKTTTEIKEQYTASDSFEKPKDTKPVEANSFQTDFEEAWNEYPRKVGRKDSYIRYKNLRKKYPHEVIVKAIQKYAATVKGKDPQYTLHGSTFFNSRIYDYLNTEDKPAEKKELIPLQVPPNATMAEIDEIIRKEKAKRGMT